MLKIGLCGCNGRMGKVITDIVSKKENMKIVAGFDAYTEKLTALTHGRGWCAWQSDHYAPCENAAAIIEERQYNPQWETPDSIFCARGAGFNVAWDKVKDFAHVHSEANP